MLLIFFLLTICFHKLGSKWKTQEKKKESFERTLPGGWGGGLDSFRLQLNSLALLRYLTNEYIDMNRMHNSANTGNRGARNNPPGQDGEEIKAEPTK